MLTRLLDKFKSAKPSGKSGLPDAKPEEIEWQAGDTILQRYKIEQVFSGAMGKVYIAQHLGWNIPVAIKVPKPEVVADQEGAKRIFTEADSWVRMGMHPNVATCFYVQSINGIPHLFIEFVDGGDLSTWLKTGRCRDLRTAISMAIQFCHGMEFTHSKGIIHRDIKPPNILVTKNALVKITDFGIVQSTTLSGATTAAPLSGSGQGQDENTVGFRGTPGYASPEQFRDTHNVDFRTDIFSFGICLWLMFCGRKPYVNNQIAEALNPTPPAGGKPFPPILTHLLKRSVAFDRDDRYPNFTELRKDLNRAHVELYRVDCPYMELDFTDLEAENYNNRAVSFLELGKTKEANACLAHALEINDALPEAIFNTILLKWRDNRTPVPYLYRQLEAIRQRVPKAAMLESLSAALKAALPPAISKGITTPQSPPASFPEYTLCLPRNSVDVFRTSQLHLAAQRNINDLLAKQQYPACHDILSRSWENICFRKDSVFISAYEQLLAHATIKGIKSVIRLKTLPGAGSKVKDPIVLPGNTRMIYRSPAGKVIIRSLEQIGKLKVLDAYPEVATIALNISRGLLALASANAVHLLSLKTGAVAKTLPAPHKVTAVSFTPDGAGLSCGDENGAITTIDLATGKTSTLQSAKSLPVRSLLASEKRPECISGHEDGTICFWDHKSHECIRLLAAHALPVTILSPTADGTLFLSGSDDRVIKIWNRQSGRQLSSIEPHEDSVNAAMMMKDNVHFITAGDDDLIKVWDIDSGRCLHVLEGGGDGIGSLAMGDQPHLFWAGRNDGAIIAWMVIYDLEFA